jgi:hypothetical protein
VKQVAQKRPDGHTKSSSQAGAHAWLLKTQTLPGEHGLTSSHCPGPIGTHAERQSRHPGQLEVAHASQIKPAEQLAQYCPSHDDAHAPVAKMHTPSGQSRCSEHPTGPVVVVGVPVDALELEPTTGPVPVVAAPPPPSPTLWSTATLPPQAKTTTSSPRAIRFMSPNRLSRASDVKAWSSGSIVFVQRVPH